MVVFQGTWAGAEFIPEGNLLTRQQRILLPPLARDVQPVLLSVRVLCARQLHSPDLPCVRRKPRAPQLLQVHWADRRLGHLPPPIP